MKNKRVVLIVILILVGAGYLFYQFKHTNDRASHIHSVLEKHHLQYQDLNSLSPALDKFSSEEIERFNDKVDMIIDSIDKTPIPAKP